MSTDKLHSNEHKYPMMRDVDTDERPREKMLKHGAQMLTNAELLQVLLGSGTQDMSVIEVSKALLKHADDKLSNLGKFTIDDYTSVKGIGKVKALTLMAAMQLGYRRMNERCERPHIDSAQSVYELMRDRLIDSQHEEFWILLLNRKNDVTYELKISSGGTVSTVVDVKLILREAINKLASGIILIHNHPSNNNRPSRDDDMVTNKIKAASELVDIKVLDHVIVCETSYYSYANEGKL